MNLGEVSLSLFTHYFRSRQVNYQEWVHQKSYLLGKRGCIIVDCYAPELGFKS
jgi:hypothetical protein